MITVYDEDDGLEEKVRTAEGYHVSYQGFHTHIRWSDEKRAYYGQIEGINDLVTYERTPDDLKGQILQFSVINAFVRAVNDYVMEHPQVSEKA